MSHVIPGSVGEHGGPKVVVVEVLVTVDVMVVGAASGAHKSIVVFATAVRLPN
jgi:hypothetical protein